MLGFIVAARTGSPAASLDHELLAAWIADERFFVLQP